MPGSKMLGLLWLLAVAATTAVVDAIQWQHSAQLDDAYRMLWTVHPDTITIEVQVRTRGYVGLGFARSPKHDADGDRRDPAAAADAGAERAGADIVVGWVDRGQTYFQDRHFKQTGAVEPRIDPSDDYTLLLGYENATHTVLRFERRWDTCDVSHDAVITNDTMRIIYMYHPSEPRFGAVVPGSLPQPHLAYRGAVPLQLLQRLPDTHAATSDPSAADADADGDGDGNSVRPLDLLNEDVPMPLYEETLQWCRVFDMAALLQHRKHHAVRFEPAFGSARSRQQLDAITLYECQGQSVRLAAWARERGRQCGTHHANRPQVPCNAIVASWTRGSAGLTLPPEAGIPLDPGKERFYLMESHYSNTEPLPADGADADLLRLSGIGHTAAGPLLDESGLRVYVTQRLRRHDAGVLSIGMNPDWRHIIPPGHEHVISEGHCVDDCTRRTFPPAGISIFAVVMQTHSIGKAVRLRQIRQHEELLPIASDAGVHAAYAEYRHVQPAARVLPGDSMVVECTYDSTARDTITLGGLATRAESCNALAVYYPRQKRLTACHSLPSLPTVLHALGIAEIDSRSQPVLIAAPAALAGQTLESRLLGYDWARGFESFQRVTRAGSFQAVCTDARHKTVLGTDTQFHYAPAVSKIWRSPRRSQCLLDHDADADDHNVRSNDITDVTEIVRDRFDHNGIEYMGLSAAPATLCANAALVTAALLRLLLQ